MCLIENKLIAGSNDNLLKGNESALEVIGNKFEVIKVCSKENKFTLEVMKICLKEIGILLKVIKSC